MLIREYTVLNVTNIDINLGELKVAIKAGKEVDLLQLPGITLGQIEKAELYGSLGYRLDQKWLVRTSVDYGIKSITIGDTEYVGEFNFTAGEGIELSEDADGTTISYDGTGAAQEVLDVDVSSYMVDVDEDEFLSVSYTSSGAAEVILPEDAEDGQSFTIKDEAGNAGANNITVSVAGGIKIDDEDEYIITGDYDSITAMFSKSAGQYLVY